MLSEETIKIFEYLGDKFGIAIDWTNQNIMPYMQDLIQRIKIYNIVDSVLGIVAGIIMLIIAYTIFMKFKKEDYDVDEIVLIFGWVAMICLAIFGLCGVFMSINSLIQNIYLPEKAILEMIKNIR